MLNLHLCIAFERAQSLHHEQLYYLLRFVSFFNISSVSFYCIFIANLLTFSVGKISNTDSWSLARYLQISTHSSKRIDRYSANAPPWCRPTDAPRVYTIARSSQPMLCYAVHTASTRPLHLYLFTSSTKLYK